MTSKNDFFPLFFAFFPCLSSFFVAGNATYKSPCLSVGWSVTLLLLVCKWLLLLLPNSLLLLPNSSLPLHKLLLPLPKSFLLLPNRLRQGLPCIRPCFLESGPDKIVGLAIWRGDVPPPITYAPAQDPQLRPQDPQLRAQDPKLRVPDPKLRV